MGLDIGKGNGVRVFRGGVFDQHCRTCQPADQRELGMEQAMWEDGVAKDSPWSWGGVVAHSWPLA